jgi:hypothetical protein
MLLGETELASVLGLLSAIPLAGYKDALKYAITFCVALKRHYRTGDSAREWGAEEILIPKRIDTFNRFLNPRSAGARPVLFHEHD